MNDYENFDHNVNVFLDDYLIKNLETFDENKFRSEFESMVKFTKESFSFGFAKLGKAKATPRVRFEAISVGVALVLREKPNLKVTNVYWINLKEFKEYTTSDASNYTGQKHTKRVTNHGEAQYICLYDWPVLSIRKAGGTYFSRFFL